MKFRTKAEPTEEAGPAMQEAREIRGSIGRRGFPAAGMLFLVLFIASGARAGNSGSATLGKAAFQEHCVMCHGPDASGHTAIAKAIGPIPDYRSKTVQSLTDAQIRAVITDGKGKMPPARGVTDTQITNLIAFIRSLAKK